MNPKPSKLVTAVYIAGSTILGTCLHFVANADWRFWFEKVALFGKFTLAAILLPLVLLIDYAKVGLAARAIYQAKEATPFNVSHLMVEIIKSALATPAILGVIGAITLPALVGPALFITAICVGVAYNIALTTVHAWQWFHATSEDESYKQKLLTIKYGSAVLLGALLAVGVGLVLLSGFGAAAIFAIGLATAATLLVGGIAVGVLGYNIDRTLAQDGAPGAGGAPVPTQAEVLRPLMDLSPDETKSVSSGLHLGRPQEPHEQTNVGLREERSAQPTYSPDPIQGLAHDTSVRSLDEFNERRQFRHA